jgi:hypothetical protein
LRRARKDLEKEKPKIIEETPTLVAMWFAGYRIEFDARGPSRASCSVGLSRSDHAFLVADYPSFLFLH